MFEKILTSRRCSYNECKVELLVGAREYHCWWDIAEAIGKLTFDGTIDQIKCITSHPDYIAVTNQTNLKMVAPFLKDRTGRLYRRRGNQTENEYVKFQCCSCCNCKILQISSGNKIGVKFKFLLISEVYSP